YLLDGLDLFVNRAGMTGFIGRLDVDPNKVVSIQCVDPIAALGVIVGVEVTRSPRHVDHLQPGKPAEPANHVYRSNNPACHPALPVKWRQDGRAALSPRPKRVGGGLSLIAAAAIEGKIVQKLYRIPNELAQARLAISLRQYLCQAAIHVLVRSVRLDV